MLEIGKPYLWKSLSYGNVAVHFTGFSPNGDVANFTIDGGEASTPAQRFPELSDGVYFAPIGNLSKRPARRKAAAGTRTLPTLPTAEEVRNVSAKEAVAMVKPARKARIIRTAQQEVTF